MPGTELGGGILEHHVGPQEAPAGILVVELQLAVRKLGGLLMQKCIHRSRHLLKTCWVWLGW